MLHIQIVDIFTFASIFIGLCALTHLAQEVYRWWSDNRQEKLDHEAQARLQAAQQLENYIRGIEKQNDDIRRERDSFMMNNLTLLQDRQELLSKNRRISMELRTDFDKRLTHVFKQPTWKHNGTIEVQPHELIIDDDKAAE